MGSLLSKSMDHVWKFKEKKRLCFFEEILLVLTGTHAPS